MKRRTKPSKNRGRPDRDAPAAFSADFLAEMTGAYAAPAADADAGVGDAPTASTNRQPAPQPRPRILALDVGTVRIGVALSSPLGNFAQPLEVVPRKGAFAARIVALAAEYAVTQVVVGRPLRLGGEAGPAALATEKFMDVLGPQLPCPWIWWDERLSTRAVERDMIALGARRQERRGAIDKVAAAWILQGYLDAQGVLP